MKLGVVTSTVALTNDSDGFELIPKCDSKTEGYSIMPFGKEKFKVGSTLMANHFRSFYQSYIRTACTFSCIVIPMCHRLKIPRLM